MRTCVIDDAILSVDLKRNLKFSYVEAVKKNKENDKKKK